MVFLTRGRSRSRLIAVLLGAASIVSVSAVARSTAAPILPGQRPPAEESLKAAYLYNFTKFIEWPDSAFTGTSAPFTVCVFADDRFRREVDATLRGEKVGSRPIELAAANPDDLKQCHMAYFSRVDAERLAKRLPEMRMAPVLTVGEGLQFLEQGGLIGFVIESDRVRFAVSRRGAATAGLNVSSKLLRVAKPFDGVPVP
jgi:hypothetical protein